MFVRLEEELARRHLSADDPQIGVILDESDPLRSLREEFILPYEGGRQLIYFCGNSLGPQPRRLHRLVEEELAVWAQR